MLQKSLSGAPKPGSLDDIQRWFEILTDILWHFYSLASQFKLLFEVLPITKSLDDRERIENLLKAIVAHLTTLIMQSFVVDKQPPQVLKTQTKFQGLCKLLSSVVLLEIFFEPSAASALVLLTLLILLTRTLTLDLDLALALAY